MGAKLTHEQFTTKAITSLRTEGYKGIHAVYSGFNSAFKAYFQADPKEATNALAKEGKIAIVPAKGGVMLYLAADKPESADRSKTTLAKMGL